MRSGLEGIRCSSRLWNHSQVRSKILTNSSHSNVGQRLLTEILPNFLSLSYSTKSNIIFLFWSLCLQFILNMCLFLFVSASLRLTFSPHIHKYKLQLTVLENHPALWSIHCDSSLWVLIPCTPSSLRRRFLIISESPNWNFPIAHILSSFQYMEASLL